MRIGGVHGRNRTMSAWQRVALGALAGFIITASNGCSIQRAERDSAGTEGGSASKKTTAAAGTKGTAKTSAKSAATSGAGTSAKSVGGVHRVRLTERGCVQLEPHWTDLGIGESIEWRSDLGHSVTIQVAQGAFDQTEYVVRPGATVQTGPARAAGSFAISTEPATCQGIPRGVRGASPGLTVAGTP